MTFAAAGEKVETMTTSQGANKNGQRSVRTLPFSKDTFRLITTKFYVHSSIARVISRADVPVFSSSKIRMQDENGISHPTYVYNCRTTNAWDMDLALTATYFPHCGLTFVVVFGCSLSVEEEILKRLSFAMAEAAHPLLMPGIFAEIERSRQVHIVEATIDELETRILLLDLQSSDMEGMLESEAEKRNQEKRTAWLDTAYLRNALISWNTQLAKICQHVDRLGSEVFKLTKLTSPSANCKMNLEHNVDRGKDLQEDMERDRTRKGLEDNKEMFQQTGQKIKDRIQGIIDEYDDKIRDCTMRVDGMAMATQWARPTSTADSHGETNVQIALATSRDSRHMRSIAIVTMVFLPGTFFATVFSMTFFNWFGSGGAVVSPYFYIYVLFTVCFTLITLGSWWYFVSYRHSSRQKSSLEEEIPLV
ncbi:hypothetical protein F5882DRAFT_493652 [Hyaloscypha sp. PMI_1271]|nr:hypothetical protein F5882DRAFT_493652 [Hyaloscypha sp. PMI_1271]